MTNTQTKVARLTARMERLERAIEGIVAIADPSVESDSPFAYEKWYQLKEIVRQIRTEERAKGTHVDGK